MDHALYDALLKQYVNDDGLVDYEALKVDAALTPYLHQLALADPTGWPEPERLAYWINVYNAYTLQLIVDAYPVRSIKRITPFRLPGVSLYFPKLNSPWEFPIVELDTGTYTLDHVEHQIIRKQFAEPRIHFALVCAARSCPRLRREAYTGARLDAQLDEQARDFLHDTSKNRIPDSDDTIRLSPIFLWFGRDLAPNVKALQAALAPYFAGTVREKLAAGGYRVRYLKYDWSLNRQ